ncbi:MAG: hypothetical protein Q9203_003836 [Teloschistes exilis]
MEIEISAMSDHTCVKLPASSAPLLRALDSTMKPPGIPGNMTGKRSLKAPPFRIEPAFANPSSGASSQRGMSNHQSASRNISPTMSETSQKSTRMLFRTVTAPSPFQPPPPDVSLAQDCAFPPFPSSRSRSTTPTTPSDPNQSFSVDATRTDHQTKPDGPAHPKPNDTGLLQRMDSIAPGPFNVGDRGIQRLQGHQRNTTAGSNASVFRSSNSSNGSQQSGQSSISDTTQSRNPSLSSIAGGPRSFVQRAATDLATVQDLPTLADDRPKHTYSDKSTRPVHASSQAGRSQAYPFQSQQGVSPIREKPKPSRRPSEPAVIAAMKPLDEIGSTSSFKSSRSLKGRHPTSNSGQTSGRTSQSYNAPRVPSSLPVRSNGDPHHTPSESVSSNESSSSDTRSISSRSTPPLSASPQRRKQQLSNGQASLLQDFRFGTESVPIIEEPTPPHRNAPPSFSRPIYVQPAEAPRPLQDPAILIPDSPTDPAIQPGRPALIQAPSDFNAPVVPLQNGHLGLSPAPPLPPAVLEPPRKPTATNKGKCRGCGELIKGKSVSSADGRLTGRYHRSCFTCKTCREPFQTADFYVLDNHPFCARHYHELNGSLCKCCDKGIEGQYLETELKQKFHPYCFTCQDCHKILRDDYFEVNGKTYCEQHAFGVAQQQTSPLGPGRRHPERRTTRLMMM